MAPNSTDQSAADHEQRVRERAYHLWEADGCPHGRATEFWERAAFLVGIEENPDAGQLPNPMTEGDRTPPATGIVDEAALQENLGEFPDRFSDQGDRQQTPSPRRAGERAKNVSAA